MLFKNERLTVIHLPDTTTVLPGHVFTLAPTLAHTKNPAIKVYVKANWITPQDEEARTYAALLESMDDAATDQRLRAIDAAVTSGQVDKAFADAARAHAADLKKATQTVQAHPTPQAQAQAAAKAKADRIAAIATADEATLLAFAAGEGDPEVNQAILARGTILAATPSVTDHSA